MNNVETLKKCSRCKSTILLKYFSKNRKGEYFKCCDGCKKERRKATTSPEEVATTDAITGESLNNSRSARVVSGDDITPSLEFIDTARSNFIYSIIRNSDKALEWLGQVNPDDIDMTRFKPELTGKEKLIEYHVFQVIGTKMTMVMRWRLNFDERIDQPILILTPSS